MEYDHCASAFLFQQLSVLIQHYNAVSVAQWLERRS